MTEFIFAELTYCYPPQLVSRYYCFFTAYDWFVPPNKVNCSMFKFAERPPDVVLFDDGASGIVTCSLPEVYLGAPNVLFLLFDTCATTFSTSMVSHLSIQMNRIIDLCAPYFTAIKLTKPGGNIIFVLFASKAWKITAFSWFVKHFLICAEEMGLKLWQSSLSSVLIL